MGLGEVTVMNSSSPLLPRQSFLEEKLLQGNSFKRHGFFSSETFFPPNIALLELNSDFVPLQVPARLCCPYKLGSLPAPRGALKMEDD